MNKEIALANINKLLLGEDSIPVQLRMRAGLNREQYNTLITSTEYLVNAYKNEATIPKILALAFVDISSHFFFKEGTYPEAELEELEDAAILLTSLANQLFDPV